MKKKSSNNISTSQQPNNEDNTVSDVETENEDTQLLRKRNVSKESTQDEK